MEKVGLIKQEGFSSEKINSVRNQKYAIWKLDLSSLKISIDEVIIEMLNRIGFGSVTSEISMIEFSEKYIHPADIAFIKERYHEAVQNKDNPGYADRFECRIVSTDKTAYVINVNARISTAGVMEGKAQNTNEEKITDSKFKNQEIGFRSVINNTSDYVFTVTPEGRFILWNNNYAFAAKHYFNKEIEVGMLATDVLPEEKRSEWMEVLYAALDGNGAKAELSLDLDKRYFYEVSANPIKGINNSIQGVACWVKDVTEKKLAIDIDHLESRVLGFALQNSSLDDALYLLLSGIEELVPTLKTFVTILDKNKHELKWQCAPRIPDNYLKTIPSIPIGLEWGSAGAAAYTRKPVFVNDIANSESWRSYRDISLLTGFRACFAFPIINPLGNILGTLGTYLDESRDLSAMELEFIERVVKLSGILLDRHAAIESASKKEIQLKRLSTSVPGIIYETKQSISGERKFVYVSDKSYDLIGLKPEELLKDSTLIWKCIHVDDAENLRASLKASVQTLQPWNFEFRIIKSNSRIVRWVRVNAEHTYNEDGTSSTFGTFFDIHDLKIKEQSSQQKENVLAEKISALNNGAVIRQKNNYALLSGLLKLQQLYVQNKDSVNALKSAKLRLKTIETVNGNFYEKNDFSLVEFNLCILEISNFIKDEYFDSLKDIKVVTDTQSHNLDNATSVALSLILNELLSNAFMHAFHEIKNAEVAVRFSKSGGYYVLEVSDNGIGVSEKTKIDQARKMGYSLIKTLVTRINGNLEIKTAKNKGFSATITFPE